MGDVVEFKTKPPVDGESNPELDKEFYPKKVAEEMEGIRKALVARDSLMQTMINDMMSMNLQIAMIIRVLKGTGITDAVLTASFKREVEDMKAASSIINDTSTSTREKLLAAKTAGILEGCAHFDPYYVLEIDKSLSNEEKKALVEEFLG